MKEKKSPLSYFDDDIGDDFLSAWKPSKMNSVANLDFDCSQVNAPEKTFKLPENIDLDMPDFGTGLNSKLSSFDIDLDFLKSPKHGDSAREDCGEALMTQSQTSSDALQASSDHDASCFPGDEREDVAAKTRHVEEKRHDQVDAKITCKAADSGEMLAWGSRTEMATTALDSSEKGMLEETDNETMKGAMHDSSFSKSYEGAASMQEWRTTAEQLDTAEETSEQPQEDATGHKIANSAVIAMEEQEQILMPAQAVSEEMNTVAGVIVSGKNTEEVTPKRIESKTERRSLREMLQGVTKPQTLELQSVVEEISPKQIETKSEQRSSRGTLQGVKKEQISLELQSTVEEVTPKHIESKTERRSFREALQGVTKQQSLQFQSVAEEVTPKHFQAKSEHKNLRRLLQEVTKEQISLEKLQSVGMAINIENITKQTDLQPSCCRNSGESFETVPEIQGDKDQAKQEDTEPWKDIAAGQATKTSATEHSQEFRPSSTLTKDLNKVDALKSSRPLGAKLQSTAPKQSLSSAFMSLKPTQVSALRTSRSHALPLLRFEKQIGDPASKADDEQLQSNLKAQVNVETKQRSSLQGSRPPLTLSKKRSLPPLELSADHTLEDSGDVPKRSVNEATGKRPKLQAAHRTKQGSNEFKFPNAGQGELIIPAIGKPNISKRSPQAASHSRPSSSLSRLTSFGLTRLHQKGSGSTSAAMIELPTPEDTFVVKNSLCAQSSLSHGPAVDPATTEIVKKSASEMNHKPESIHHIAFPKKPKNLVPHLLPKKTRDNLTDATIDKYEVVENAGYHKMDEKKGSNPPLKDNRGGYSDSEMHEEAECNEVTFGVSCPQLLLEDLVEGQTCAKEIMRGRKNISKTAAHYSVELDKIMSTLKQKQRRAKDLLAEIMAYNVNMKYLLDSKNQEKITILQKSIEERLEGVEQQTAGNRAKKCQWCDGHREDKAAALIKEHCNASH